MATYETRLNFVIDNLKFNPCQLIPGFGNRTKRDITWIAFISSVVYTIKLFESRSNVIGILTMCSEVVSETDDWQN